MQPQFTRHLASAKGLLIIGMLVAVVMVACSSDEEPQQPATARPAATAQPAAQAEKAATARPTVGPGCNRNRTPGTTGQGKAAQAGPLSGEIVIDGSSTVYPVSVAAAEDFRKEHPQVQIPVGISGTGGGFKKFAAGETVISDASRPIKDSERELAAQNGITFIELAVAYDGLSVLVNPDNDWATCLTTDQLHEIWKPDSEVTNWNQVDPSYPDLDIVLYGPDADSGTFDYFTEEINGDTGVIRDDFFPAVDDNVLVQGIAGDRGALGYFGYAYYVANTDKLKLVNVDGGAGCIEPNETTINDGSYSPLSRPLYIYVNIPSLSRPEVKAFVDYYLQNAADLAASVGYVGLPQQMYDDALALVANPVMVAARPALQGEAAQADPLSGEIVIDGSSTVYPVSVAAAEDFRKEHPQVQIPVGISGTGGGFKKFAAGETVISDASRPIKDSERELAAQNGVTFIELAVAYDGLSVLVNPDNDWATCLTTDQLHEIWKPDSEISNWNQVDPSYPDLDIVLYGPDADSGTFDYFTEEINGDTGVIRDDFFPAVDDNVLVQGIAGDRGALGYFGYAYYVANTDKLKLVGVDGGAGCIEPNETTINDGSYSPLSRPLYIYVNIPSLSRPEVKAFVDYYLQNAADLAASVGYVGLPQQMYDEGLALVANAATNGGSVQR